MKEEILRVLDLLEKKVITSDEANEIIKSLKEIQKNDMHEEKCNKDSGDKKNSGEETSSNESNKSGDIMKSIEDSIKDLGDQTNEVIKKVQPKVLEFSRKLLEGVAESSRKMSDHIDKNMSSNKKEDNEADDIINKYKENDDYEQK